MKNKLFTLLLGLMVMFTVGTVFSGASYANSCPINKHCCSKCIDKKQDCCKKDCACCKNCSNGCSKDCSCCQNCDKSKADCSCKDNCKCCTKNGDCCKNKAETQSDDPKTESNPKDTSIK